MLRSRFARSRPVTASRSSFACSNTFFKSGRRSRSNGFPIPVDLRPTRPGEPGNLADSLRAARSKEKLRALQKPLPPSNRGGRRPAAERSDSRSVSDAESSGFRSQRKLTAKRPAASSISDIEESTSPAESTRPTPAILRSHVESSIDDLITNHFLFPTQQSVQQYCGSQSHSYFYKSISAYIQREKLTSDPVRLFWSALDGHLPPDRLNSNVVSRVGKFNYKYYGRTVDRRGVVHDNYNRMGLAWHHLMFNKSIRAKGLLFDGTDRRFLPGSPDIWKHRLWAGGSITLFRKYPLSTDGGARHHMIERPSALRIVGQQSPKQAFVTVTKSIFQLEGCMTEDEYLAPGAAVGHLVARPTFASTSSSLSSRSVRERLMTDKGDKPIGSDGLLAGPHTEEQYTLCFLRDPPDFSRSSTRVITPFASPKFTHTLTPDRHLLFCWSSVTYNAHLIHLDSAFVQKEYGAPNLLVQGPLVLYLMLEWVQRTLGAHTLERGMSPFHIRHIDYKNLQPLYADEPMTLRMKRSRFATPGELADSWVVWIEKDLGEGLTTMAFKADIKVQIEPVFGDSRDAAQDWAREGFDAANAGNVEDEEPTYKSPYFSD